MMRGSRKINSFLKRYKRNDIKIAKKSEEKQGRGSFGYCPNLSNEHLKMHCTVILSVAKDPRHCIPEAELSWILLPPKNGGIRMTLLKDSDMSIQIRTQLSFARVRKKISCKDDKPLRLTLLPSRL